MKKYLGFGLLIWVIMFAVASVFAAYKVGDKLWAEIILMAVNAVMAFVFARLAKPTSIAGALLLGLAWVVIGIVLDLIISRRFAPDLFKMWPYWVSYALVLLVPMLAVKKAATSAMPA